MSKRGTKQMGPMLAPRSPLAAYRDDLARSGRTAFGASDATWLSLATVVSHAIESPSDGAPPLFSTLRDVVVGDPALSPMVAAASDGDSAGSVELDPVSRLVRAVVDVMEDAGALSLAYSTLALLAEADLRLGVLERGRVIAQLGRVAWKAGALDTSREQYRRAEVLGRTARIPELQVRAWVGYSILARLRGNYPDVRKWAARAAHEAERCGLRVLESLACHSLMVSSAVAGDLNGALIYGWRAYQGAIGDAAREPSALLNLSQFLLESGHPEVALRGFMATLRLNPNARVALPAYGGLALASSALGDAAGVHAALARAEGLVATSGLPYESAAALVELSQALTETGDREAAADCRDRALEISERHAYHELTHRLHALVGMAPTSRAEAAHAFDPEAAEVARAVASLAGIGPVVP